MIVSFQLEYLRIHIDIKNNSSYDVSGVNFMPDYQKMYAILFNAMTDAIENMEDANYGTAKEILIQAQQKTEELYIEAE